MLQKFLNKNSLGSIVFAIVLFSPWLPLWLGFTIALSVLLPFVYGLQKLEEWYSPGAIFLNAIFHLCAAVDVVADIALCLIYVISIFLEMNIPFIDLTTVIQFVIARIVLTVVGLFPSVLGLYYLPSSTGGGTGTGGTVGTGGAKKPVTQQKKSSSTTVAVYSPGTFCLGFLFLAVLCKIVVLCVRLFIMIKSLLGLNQPELERKRTAKTLAYCEALILFDYLFSSLPLAVLTIVEAIAYGAFNHRMYITNYLSIFFLLKFIGAAGAAFINCKVLFFEIYGFNKQKSKPDTRPLLNNAGQGSSTTMTTVGSIQAASTTLPSAPKTTFQQKVDAARQRGDKAEVNRLREVGDVGYVQNTIRQLDKVKGDRAKLEAILEEDIKKYDTIYRSRLYTAKSLKDTEEEAHVVALAEQTSKKLKNLRDQYLN